MIDWNPILLVSAGALISFLTNYLLHKSQVMEQRRNSLHAEKVKAYSEATDLINGLGNKITSDLFQHLNRSGEIDGYNAMNYLAKTNQTLSRIVLFGNDEVIKQIGQIESKVRDVVDLMNGVMMAASKVIAKGEKEISLDSKEATSIRVWR